MDKYVIVFGGAFNPVTSTHLALAEQLTNEYCVEKVVFMPVSDLYVKGELLPSKHRVTMLEQVFKTNSKFEVSKIEVDSKELLRTIDSLNIIKNKYKNYKIAFLMGSDNLRDIPIWYKAEELLSEFTFMIVMRDGDDFKEIIESSEVLKMNKHNLINVKAIIRNDGSSTYVRELIRAGKSIRYLVTDEVYEYIQNNNLFRD
jgi:nicotinate-nucleotide adenylyltransferase